MNVLSQRHPPLKVAWLMLLGATLLTTLPAARAEIYTWKDADGNTVFSDQPAENAAEVKLPPLQTFSGDTVKPRPEPVTQKTGNAAAVEPYRKLAISKPADDEARWSSNGQIDVVVAIEPALMVNQGHYLSLAVDGVTRIEQSRTTHMTLAELDRGTHRLSVSVHDGNGKTLKTGKPITFHIHRPSLLNK